MLPEVLVKLIDTEKVRVVESNGVIQLIPIKEAVDCTTGLRGLFSDFPEMSVDRFLARKRADKGLER